MASALRTSTSAVSEAPEPVLAYTRIESNKRTTRFLLGTFAVVFLPVVSTGALIVMPIVSIVMGFTGQAIWGNDLIIYIQMAEAVMESTGSLSLRFLPPAYLFLLGGTVLVSFGLVLLALLGAATVLIDRHGAAMVLRTAHALPVWADQEPELVRVVENLCIAAGLPQPTLYVVESPTPNALAAGSDPSRASLVVTRGLLTLLDRRELEAVIAHELSHIGNYDIRLSTTLAALVTISSWPLRVLARFFRPAGPTHYLPIHRFVFGAGAALITLKAAATFLLGLSVMLGAAMMPAPNAVRWWTVHAMLAPIYAMFLSPLCALLIRQAVSWEREFLADADATLLTRDPEGLALALVKVGAARGDRLRVSEGVIHLYFVDPFSWSTLHRFLPSHPPLGQRIELLARMGSGIGREALEAAMKAGLEARQAEPEPEPISVSATATEAPAEPERIPVPWPEKEVLTPLYERPDGWSKVLAKLPADAQITIVDTEGNFVRVRTGERVLGYVSRTAPLAALAALRAAPV
jgi:heat shock protein HtpX